MMRGMAEPPRPVPGRAQRWQAVARMLASAVALVLLYAVRPVERPPAAIIVALVVGLGLLVWLLVWQVRAVERSAFPVLRAVEAFVTAAVLFVVLFATGYAALSESLPGSFTEPLGRVGALYFTVTVLATVGFGDIAPVSDAARVVTTIQMVCGLAFVGLVGRQFLAAARRARGLPAGEEDPPAG